MVTHNGTFEAAPHMRGMDNRDGNICCYGRYKLEAGTYRAAATTVVPIESELLVFDRDANLFLAQTGSSPAIEFELLRPQSVVVMGKVNSERAAFAPDIHVRSVTQAQRPLALAA